ncbi:hypothetical protein SDC9_45380 [bioreactor metagenome]|uniref:Thiamine-binding protein domain-containing protein n=1 Tax=bioreactor metagenome TaxID=1076179 RepID=A0A644W5V7_9ZZZZ
MKLSIDISYYPLTEDFKAPIKKFIAQLHTYSEIAVKSNGMSTQVFGEYADVMRIVTKEIESAMELPHSIFILKMANAQLDKDYNPHK